MIPPAAIDELRLLAAEVAMAAARLADEGRRAEVAAGNTRSSMTAATKSTRTDVVTRHDRAAEAAIVAGIQAHRPDDGVLGEEGTARPGTSGLEWYIDPIDGTTNFLYGLPLWSTSVAVADRDGALAGAVYIPGTGELFSAGRGRGATRNDVPIEMSMETDLALTLVATGFGYDAALREKQGRRVATIVPAVRDLRRTGSAAIDLCYTAAGIVDAYFEEALNRWDVAAGELIAREAGCRSGDFGGGPFSPAELLVAPPQLFDQLSTLLSEADPSG